MHWLIFSIISHPYMAKLVTSTLLIYRLYKKFREKAIDSDELIGRVVFITGASSGLGEALAEIFYRCGAQVILVARREEELNRVKQKLLTINLQLKRKNECEPFILKMDLADIDSIEGHIKMFEERFKKIDFLINNAGMSYRGEIANTSMDVHMRLMLVNYFGHVALTQAILPMMIKRGGGHIVTIGSVQGRIAIPYRSAYAASKHALQAFFDVLRSEVASKNIRVSVVTPSYINTHLSLNAIEGDGKNYGRMDANTENGYSPDFVANVILESMFDNDKEVIIAPFFIKFGIVLRALFPSFVFKYLAKKAIQ